MNRREFMKSVPVTLMAVQASRLAMGADDETNATGSGGGADRVAGDL